MASFDEELKNQLNTPDTTNQYDSTDIENNKVFALLSYIGFLFLIPLLAAKDSAYAKFHCNQGMILFLAEVCWNIISSILNAILPILGIVCYIINLVFLALVILGIVNAVTGKAKELPVIGKYRILK